MAWQAAEVLSLLRWQRHDILNHLQVISGCLQLHKSERAREYLTEVVTRLEQVGNLLRLKQPDLAVVSLCKMEQAEARGITLDLKVHTIMQDLAIAPEVALALWEAAWELALALPGDGQGLRVELTEVAAGYYLHFQAPAPVPLPAGAADHLTALAGRQGVSFIWQPETGEMGLILPRFFSGRGPDPARQRRTLV